MVSIADSMTGSFGDELIGTLGTKRDYAVALRAMHMIARQTLESTSNGKGGFVSGETEGSLSRSFALSPEILRKYPDESTTIYGQELIGLIQSTFFGPRTATMNSVIGG